MACRLALALLIVASVSACRSDPYGLQPPVASAPGMDGKRKVDSQDCSKPVAVDQGNLRCK